MSKSSTSRSSCPRGRRRRPVVADPSGKMHAIEDTCVCWINRAGKRNGDNDLRYCRLNRGRTAVGYHFYNAVMVRLILSCFLAAGLTAAARAQTPQPFPRAGTAQPQKSATTPPPAVPAPQAPAAPADPNAPPGRSEERRVGKVLQLPWSGGFDRKDRVL